MSDHYGSKMVKFLYGGPSKSSSSTNNNNALNKTFGPETLQNSQSTPRSTVKFLHPQGSYSLPQQKPFQTTIHQLQSTNISIPANMSQSMMMVQKQSNDINQKQQLIRQQSEPILQLPPKPPVIQQSLSEEQYRQQRMKQAKTVFKDMTKDFISELSKSITQITKAQVNTIVNEKLASEKSSENFQNTSSHMVHSKNLVRVINQAKKKENAHYSRRLGYQSRGMSLNEDLKEHVVEDDSQQEILDFEELDHQNIKQKRKTETSFKKNNFSINQNHPSFASQEASDYLKQNIRELLRKVNKLSENKREPRSVWLDVDFGSAPCLAENRIHNLKKKIFKIFEDILSVSFHLHFKQGMDYEKVKAYCCQNFIINLCRLSNLQKLDAKELQILQEHLQEEVLPYLNLSYPRSDQKIMNKQLKRKVGQKDIFNENRFDIVYNSRVKLSTKKTDINSQVMKILNYMIKLPDEKVYEMTPNELQFSKRESKLIKNESLNQQQLSKIENGYRTLYQNFERDFQTILSKVYKKSMTETLSKLEQKQQNRIIKQISKNYWNSEQLMRDLDEKILAKIQSDIVQDNEKQKDEEQEYKEKVQTYTKFKIGRKIPAHVEPYTKQQIEEGALIMKDSSVARVLMKWAEAVEEQIQDPAKSLYLRDQPFRLHGDAGEQTYELSTEKSIKQLYGYFIRSSKVVKQKSEILKNNAREIFLQAIKSAEQVEKFRSYREFSSQNDALVGHVCTVLLKSRENHVSSYLNMLLGQIKYIEQEYQWQIEDKRINIPSRPSLINMRLGDLMRCQITSKPKEIVSVYQYISLLCKICPNIFQMVRVKNRSDTPNKDILINIFYHKKIMIEIQLAIKNESAFISCSDRFSHFIYEMQRAFLGPVNEICSIWSLYSPKSEFFIKKFNKLNIQRPESNKIQTKLSFGPNQCKHIYEDEERQLKLPFTCSSCTVFYYNSSIPRKCCIKCSAFQCCICNIKSNADAWIEKQYPSFEVKKDRQVGKLFYALDIQTNYRQIKEMIEVQINGKLEAYSMKISIPIDRLFSQNNSFSQQFSQMSYGNPMKDLSDINDFSQLKSLSKIKIENIKSEYEIKKLERTNLKRQLFEQTHIILQKRAKSIKSSKIKRMFSIEQKKDEKSRQDQLINQIIKQILKQHYLPKRTNVIFKKSQSFMKLTLITNPTVLPEVKGEIIKSIIDSRKEILRRIQKLNLNENGLTQIQIADKMPNARNVVLNMNSLSSLDLKGFNNLISLELASNRIKSLSNLLSLNKCVNLTRLLLNHNEITDLIGLPQQLINLQVLGLSYNNIKSIEKIPHFKNIKSLDLNYNHLKELIGIQKLKTLEELKINCNKQLAESKKGVELLKQLSSLKRLDLSETNLNKPLLQSKEILKYSLNLLNAKMEFRHKEDEYAPLLAIMSLHELQHLNASSNNLSFVPKILDLGKLIQLNLSHNTLSDTKNLKHFKKLKWLSLKDNVLVNIEKLDELVGLYWLDLSQNMINSSQLHIIGKLKNLHEIELSDNELTSLADFGSLPKLYELNIRNNKIKSLQGIERLVALEHLDARFNEQLSSLTGIEKLHMLFQLKLSGCSIRDMRALKNTQRLRILELNKCGISKIADIPILKNLQELYLNSNRLRSMDGISNFQSLKKLQIKDNKHVVVKQDDFDWLPNLSNIAFTMTPQIRLNFISHINSLQIIRIENINNKTEQQNTILISLSLLNYNIQSTQLEQNLKQSRNIPFVRKFEGKHGQGHGHGQSSHHKLRDNQRECIIEEAVGYDDQNFDDQFKTEKDLHFRHLSKEESRDQSIQ